VLFFRKRRERIVEIIRVEFHERGLTIGPVKVGEWRLFVHPGIDRGRLIEVTREIVNALQSDLGVEFLPLEKS
jgi:hypothetical protein